MLLIALVSHVFTRYVGFTPFFGDRAEVFLHPISGLYPLQGMHFAYGCLHTRFHSVKVLAHQVGHVT